VHKDTDAMYIIAHLQERKHEEMVSGFGADVIHNPKQIPYSFIYNPSLISYYPLFNRSTFTIPALTAATLI